MLLKDVVGLSGSTVVCNTQSCHEVTEGDNCKSAGTIKKQLLSNRLVQLNNPESRFFSADIKLEKSEIYLEV